MDKIISFQKPLDPTIDFPKAERLLSSVSPQRLTKEYHSSSDSTFSCGTWTCEIGHWKIKFENHKEEFFCILSGKVRIHNNQGEHWDFGPSEAAVIPAGFEGSFEVLEPATKHFVVYQKN